MAISSIALLLAQASAPLLAPPPPMITLPSPDLTDKQACALFEKVAADIQPELPKMVDKTTRLDGVVVICSMRIFQNNKFINVPVSSFREGWKKRKQAQWNEMNCSNRAFLPLVRRGWRLVQALTFISGERYIMDTKCAS